MKSTFIVLQKLCETTFRMVCGSFPVTMGVGAVIGGNKKSIGFVQYMIFKKDPTEAECRLAEEMGQKAAIKKLSQDRKGASVSSNVDCNVYILHVLCAFSL